jgi:3-hydroxybutyryl-CoA dehydrogenase
MSITTVGIIGAGTMGNGIAQACAVSGINVVMVDISDAAVQKGLATVAGSLDRLIKKEKITAADKDAALARIKASTSYDDLKAAQLVIEAATENYELKLKILKQVDGIVGPDVIIASNTSSISITKLAAATSRADKFIGMHFFNPVPMMALVEIIRGLQTSDATHDAVKAMALALGKSPITVKNAPGFVVNRILVPMINEAFLRAGRGPGHARGHRRWHEAGLQPAHRPAGPGRHGGPGRVPGRDGRVPCRIRRQQVPRLPAAARNGGRRPPGPQDGQWRVPVLSTALPFQAGRFRPAFFLAFHGQNAL